MDFEGDAEVEALQRKLDIEDDKRDEEAFGLSDSDEETIRVLDIEKLKLKSGSLSEKQRGLVLKVDGLRRRIKKLLDANNRQNSKKVQEFTQQLETTEDKLRTSLKSSKQARQAESDSEEDDGVVARLVDSDDEFDEYFDRTKLDRAIN